MTKVKDTKTNKKSYIEKSGSAFVHVKKSVGKYPEKKSIIGTSERALSRYMTRKNLVLF